MKAGLFATCLADVMRPQIGVAAVRLMRQTGASVYYPPRQTCCGQIAFNSGNYDDAANLAQQCASLFSECDVVVFPSASCCGMFRAHWQEIFTPDNRDMKMFADKCMELSEFLTHMNYTPEKQNHFTATYHDCCAGLRELNIKNSPRQLLEQSGITLTEMHDCEECCGFGGAFSVKFGGVSAAMGDRKCDNIAASGAGTVLMGDLGCILHLEGRLQRRKQNIRIMHWAEALADNIPDNAA